MAGNVYRFDPQPTQGQRFVPIPAQGDQPPRKNLALTMALVMASWPTGLEYQAPQRAPTVPIPAQGDQPPIRLLGARDAAQQWFIPPDPLPQRTRPAQIVSVDAPLPTTPPINLRIILASWQPQEPVQQRQVAFIPTAAAVAADQLPRSSPAILFALVDSWTPPPPLPQQQRRDIAPLTLTYGDQPPILRGQDTSSWYADAWQMPQRLPSVPIPAPVVNDPPRQSTAALYAILNQWQPVDWPQQCRRTFPLLNPVVNDPPAYSTVRFHAILRSWQPPDPLPQQQRRDFAPLTLRYGDQPPLVSRAALFELIESLQPPPPLPYQRGPAVAELFTAPPVVTIPPLFKAALVGGLAGVK